MTPYFYQRRGKGFTLVELLVAMGVTTLILTLLVSITGVALDGWRISRNKVRSAQQAEAAIEQLSRDFESLVIRKGNSFEWLYAGGVEDANTRQGGQGAQLAFFTAATDRYNGDLSGGLGDVCGVGYRLVYKNPVSNADDEFSVYGLYRELVNPDEAFDTLLAKDSLGGANGAFNPFFDEIDEISNFVCENIYQMTVGFLVEYTTMENDQVVTQYQRVTVVDTASTGNDQVSEFRLKGDSIDADLSDSQLMEEIRTGRITAVDISLQVVTEAAMGVIRSEALNGERLQDFLEENSFRFGKTIPIPQN